MTKSTQRPLVSLASIVLGLALATGASAQSGTAAPTKNADVKASAESKVAGADRAFVQKAAIGGMAEVAMGKIAQERASSEQVKQFGARMVQDHTKSNNELKQLASAKGIEMPADMDKKHKADAERLSTLSGEQFDKAYMQHMVDDHKQTIADFRKAAGGAKDPDIKGFAANTLPVLEQHMQLAQQTAAAVKK